ncbi:MAG: autotransporter domain-containing protein [Alphaproteobacteria bacterium]|nr:autotransporter domain-containing protein [Alphaproteobacteria bacterium]MCW5743227.1 autotransporter domain-containing protein [Alphaproteobacteria bacterium]
MRHPMEGDGDQPAADDQHERNEARHLEKRAGQRRNERRDTAFGSSVANLAYVRVRTGGFMEQGGAAALTSPAATTDVIFTTLGLRASTTFDVKGATVTATGTLGWRHAFGDVTPLSTMRLAGGGNAFPIGGVPIARDAAVVEAGVNVALTSATTLGISYGGQFGLGMSDHAAKASFSVKF